MAAGDGPVWSDQKKFMIKCLASQGIANLKNMQEVTEDEVVKKIKTFEKTAGASIPSHVSIFWTQKDNGK